ncbi:MAG: hypothetical protein AAFN18_20175 [Cyanobacteria bacterium J06554_6]
MVGWRNDRSTKADDIQLVIEALTPPTLILAAMGVGLWAWLSDGSTSDPLLRFCELVASGAVGMIVPRGHRTRQISVEPPERRPAPPPRHIRPLPQQAHRVDNPDRLP